MSAVNIDGPRALRIKLRWLTRLTRTYTPVKRIRPLDYLL